MTMPVHRQPGRMLERAFSGLREPITAELDDLYERMERLLESAAAMPSIAVRGAWAPLADLRETDDSYVVECEVPGIPREDIDVQVSERELAITGELKEREREGELRRSTRRTGRFEYRAILPTEVKADKVSASLADGVLTVTVPKAQAAKPRHIKISGPS
ncbi:Hsp20/alpha crystallin family protein [Streptomyces sp. RB6PN25]|uniref:Hsp20/alpha crystallin family protein n=1 Tax=Streptomyces humicola TaxID=2953240 RepID=A0ABT1Q1T6_9ACTN|nr:Hsp20/alpha crystallin family protein [Streptomyces humicola]MCQ4083894.1 Hsp20/alpha crystallin family protein [Streptomyces humicola]